MDSISASYSYLFVGRALSHGLLDRRSVRRPYNISCASGKVLTHPESFCFVKAGVTGFRAGESAVENVRCGRAFFPRHSLLQNSKHKVAVFD